MKRREVLIVNNISQYHEEMNQPEKERRELQQGQIQPPAEVMELEAVLELQEEEEGEEMNQVILVKTKDQIGMKVLTLMKKKMKVV